MDAQVSAAVVTGICGIVVAIISNFVTYKISTKKSDEKIQKLDEISLKGSLSIYKAYKDECGYFTSNVIRTMQQKDLNGTVEIKTLHRNFKVLWDGLSISGIPNKTWVNHPNGKIINPTTLVYKSPNFNKNVDIGSVLVQEDGKSCTYQLEVTGGLTKTDPPLDWEEKTVIAHGVCVTREEMEDVYKQDEFKNEYHSIDIMHPMDTLKIKVEFPEVYKVQLFPIVFYLDSEFVNNRELERVKDKFKLLSSGAEFEIDMPRIGMRYAIYWIPPTKKEIAQLLS
jgi:hypothetical protein